MTILRLFFFWGRVNSESVEEEEEEWEMVQRKGTQFTLNGKPFYVNGFNTYWMMTLAADNSTRGKVTDVFQQASAVGLTVGRTWAFNDGQWRALQKSPSVYDEDVFKVYISTPKKPLTLLLFFLFKRFEQLGAGPGLRGERGPKVQDETYIVIGQQLERLWGQSSVR